MGSQPWLLGFIFLLLKIQSFASAQLIASGCRDNMLNYTSNSEYDANLNSVLSSISTNIDDNGFYNVSAGKNPNRVNAIALCRGDIQLDKCRSCVEEAKTHLAENCHNQKQGIVFLEFCLLRFSNATIFGVFVSDPIFFLYNVQNSTNLARFVMDRAALIKNLTEVAAGGSSRRKIASGIQNTFDSEKIYAIVQCSPDIFADDCVSCLNELYRTQRTYCETRIGCRALGPSCNFRYETAPFYNETRLQELQGPAKESPPAVKEEEDDDLSRTTIIFVVVAIVGCLIIAAFINFIFIKRIKMKMKQYEAVTDIGDASSLQYEFSVIKTATDNFSDSNKTGESSIYKGKLGTGQQIMVKRLSNCDSIGDDEYFKKQIMASTKLQHMNLARLLGFAINGKEKLLVYEFINVYTI